jgi:hypothetical protein
VEDTANRRTARALIRVDAARWGTIASALLVVLVLDPLGCDHSQDLGSSRALAADQSETELPATARPPAGGITAEEDAEIVPGPPGTVLVSHHPESLHRIEWQGTRDDTIRGYQVYRSCSDSEWEPIEFVKLRDDDERNRKTYVFEERFDAVCDYTVAAVDRRGSPGPRSTDIQ